MYSAVVAEWLRRLTRNQFRSAGVGSNPTDREIFVGLNLRTFISMGGILPTLLSWVGSVQVLQHPASLVQW